MPTRIFSKTEELTLLRQHRSGVSMAALAKEHGVTRHTISDALRRVTGGYKKLGRPPKRSLSIAEQATAVEMYKSGLSQEKVAQRFGTNQSAISDLLAKQGIRSRAVGPNHPNWGGGVLKSTGGYLRVWLDVSSPYTAMRDNNGYVAQHRLVLAEAIGRPLLPTESVHHINGDKSDNRLENLQLRHGWHGNGGRFQCQDCGSHNVKPVILD